MGIIKKKNFNLYLRNFVFGVEDSLVSTTGFLSGVAVSGVTRSTIATVGIVLIFVEAFSMGVGSFLSEESTNEHTTPAIKAGVVMFFSYFFAGFIPLIPYLIASKACALCVSVIFALCFLFILGTVSAKLQKKPLLKYGLRMLIIGGVAVLIGVIVGNILHAI